MDRKLLLAASVGPGIFIMIAGLMASIGKRKTSSGDNQGVRIEREL